MKIMNTLVNKALNGGNPDPGNLNPRLRPVGSGYEALDPCQLPHQLFQIFFLLPPLPNTLTNLLQLTTRRQCRFGCRIYS
ncbi:unnamed protein product [Cuscuta campestris]|uniref:Uncharacterized protein n=1 Tax=Cuscuta campestris TaxID=132261 RepID=A0A484LKM6_9ASTE|nr:unnamed protein product [Cuscuta campestris]